jgi:hypothetical protein
MIFVRSTVAYTHTGRLHVNLVGNQAMLIVGNEGLKPSVFDFWLFLLALVGGNSAKHTNVSLLGKKKE